MFVVTEDHTAKIMGTFKTAAEAYKEARRLNSLKPTFSTNWYHVHFA